MKVVGYEEEGYGDTMMSTAMRMAVKVIRTMSETG